MKKNKNEKGIAHPFTLIVIACVFAVVGFAGWRVAKASKAASSSKKETSSSSLAAKESAPVTAEAKLKEKAPETTTEVTVPAPVTSKQTAKKPTTATPPATATNTTNCGTPLYNGTNTAFMESEMYLSTKKFKAALEYAGLTGTANGIKTVVFTVSDGKFDSLSETQKTYMNLSPDNMRSVLGWHIITSCQTYDAVFRDAKAPITLQTLNGPVTYTLSGHGKVESAEIGIWDWFTTNGAVHYIGDFIKPPQI